jgi:hypothetical protein
MDGKHRVASIIFLFFGLKTGKSESPVSMLYIRPSFHSNSPLNQGVTTIQSVVSWPLCKTPEEEMTDFLFSIFVSFFLANI